VALASFETARLPDAVAAFEEAVAGTPDHAPAHAALARACFLQYEATRATNTPHRDSLARAITHARRACDLDPASSDAWTTLGLSLGAAGDPEQARAATRHAIALAPTGWEQQFGLSVTSWGEERLRACERTLALAPDFAAARFNAATVLTARQAFAPALMMASAGAASQSRQAVRQDGRFPSIGLHWLRGLLLLREQQIGLAIECFAREMDELHEAEIYAGEFRVYAQVGAGFAHLAAQDVTGAVDVFRMALETLPRHGRALVGLYVAFQRTSLAREAQSLLVQIDYAIAELTAAQRFAEAALLRAASSVARGELDAAATVLEHLLGTAPVGDAGWQIPVDPALAALRSHVRYPRILAMLAARAT
jgi:tetratricopeptide (TPR) repeat protein